MAYQTTPGPSRPPGPYGPYGEPHRQKRGKGCMYAAIGGFAVFVLLGACGVILGAASQTASTGPSAAASPAQGEAADDEKRKPSGKKTPAAGNGIGKAYRDGKFSFTVTKVKKGVQRVGNEYIGEDAQGQFVLVHVTVKNIGDQPRTFTDSNQRLYDTTGRRFQADTEAAISMGDQSKAFLEDINPGNAVKGILVFDVPDGVKLKSVELHDSLFSGGVTVPLGNR